ncbi:MAG: GDP-mannose 4,6-dehydratase [Alphaproteobacteria bacterium]|nr:GDP-mannose 4,6-dehydratase [Alphaproteobacteria bacterium]
MPTALVTGITGQDGSWLADLLVERGYEVHGIVRRASVDNRHRIAHLEGRVHLHWGDLTDADSLVRAVRAAKPDEVYNLAAQSHVAVSFELPVHTADVVALGAARLLEAVRTLCPEARFYQASTSEMFGAAEGPISEDTPFHPRNPYGAAKVYAFHLCRMYREAYGMHVSNGILFNHESERRGEAFVTRKITRAVGRIVAGTQSRLALGNLDARRDWGHAADYVDAMWRMLQRPEGGDYVVATGVSHAVRDFCERAFAAAGLDWREHVDIDPRFQRPMDIPDLVGDASLARETLGWAPTIDFDTLVGRMVAHDIELARKQA